MAGGSTEPTETSASRPRVLVVDDDAALAEMLSIVLRNEGFEPFWCAYGDKALASFRENHPDLVLLDVMLPKISGVDVCRQLRKRSQVPIIMITANEGSRHKAYAEMLGPTVGGLLAENISKWDGLR